MKMKSEISIESDRATDFVECPITACWSPTNVEMYYKNLTQKLVLRFLCQYAYMKSKTPLRLCLR